ncbi:MAG: SDR family oxidoreductase [Candidatus Sumerlaeia bacterium]|nr:SDR family oxidoreductase [Candidatus Sumerlaeia bacterium]
MPKTVLIIGASRGLGLEFARQYSADGWTVIGTVRTRDAGQALKALPGADAFAMDIRREEDFAEFARELQGRGVRPDLLIHNAGVNIRSEESFAKTSFEAWNETFAVNVTGAVGSARYLAPLLPEKAGAVAVFISSELGSIAQANGGYLPYRASKAALNMLVKCLAVEQAARGVCCAALHPGWVRTDMGGAEAPLEAPDSIKAMRKAIAALKMERTGSFLDLNGKTLPY